jgi:HEAT repeat protein
MPLVITPEVGIPLPFDVTPEEVEQFRERAAAACATIKELMGAGGEVDLTDDDSTTAHQIFAHQAPLRIGRTPPGAILKLEAMLSHYDHEFLGANRRIANYVTNRLLEETEDEDPKVRLKALELLGKRKGVNLFSEQMEITIKQKPTEDLETELTTLLEKYMGAADVVENDAPQPLVDLDAELAMLDDPEVTPEVTPEEPDPEGDHEDDDSK